MGWQHHYADQQSMAKSMSIVSLLWLDTACTKASRFQRQIMSGHSSVVAFLRPCPRQPHLALKQINQNYETTPRAALFGLMGRWWTRLATVGEAWVEEKSRKDNGFHLKNPKQAIASLRHFYGRRSEHCHLRRRNREVRFGEVVFIIISIKRCPVM